MSSSGVSGPRREKSRESRRNWGSIEVERSLATTERTLLESRRTAQFLVGGRVHGFPCSSDFFGGEMGHVSVRPAAAGLDQRYSTSTPLHMHTLSREHAAKRRRAGPSLYGAELAQLATLLVYPSGKNLATEPPIASRSLMALAAELGRSA